MANSNFRSICRLTAGLLIVTFLVSVRLRAEETPSDSTDEENEPEYSEADRSHWSFLPIQDPEIPLPAEYRQDGIANPIDAFVLKRLSKEDLKPSRQADRRTLIRRIYYGLWGLPPEPEAISEFVNNDAPDAWPRLVNRLLASPHYGEKWGQHWLDVIRFAESEGFEYDRHHVSAWRLRDYVVRSFNADKPFNQFATEQLAGDELASQREGDPRIDEVLRDQIVAAGFHRLGPVRRNAGNPEIAFSRNEVLTEMTDAVGTVFLGLTVGCARCHDHFFDPFKQKDYYRLQAFLAATNEFDSPFVDENEWTRWKSRTDSINEQIYKLKDEISNANPKRTEEIKQQLEDLKKQLPPAVPTLFSVQNVARKRSPVYLLTKGVETLQAGKPLGMRAPGVFLPENSPELAPDHEHPRTLLAEWVASKENPLTARVIVNRVWQYHFGQGLVTTANDFGLNGDPPSHPELLDWLASRLIESGWSLKALHRLILTSRTWQQSSQADANTVTAAMKVDSENRLLWRFSRRRLSAEEIRDSMLKISGVLNPRFTGKSVITPVDPEMVKLLYHPDQWAVTEDRFEHRRRSVYLIAKRNLKLPFMEVFDQPDLQTSCECREASTHAPQSLELLNGEFSNEMARLLAVRLRPKAGHSEPRLAELAFELTTGQKPNAEQVETVVEFLKTQPESELMLALFNLNAFLYVD